MTYLCWAIEKNKFADDIANNAHYFVSRYKERTGMIPNTLLVNPKDMDKLPKYSLTVGDVNLIAVPSNNIQQGCVGIGRMEE